MRDSLILNLNSILLLLIAFQGLVFAILLIFKRQPTRSINIHLVIMLLAITAETLHQFLFKTQLIYQVSYLAGFVLPLDSLVGIALYWYVRTIIHPEKDNSIKRVLGHYSIFFVCFILSFPFWSLGTEAKLTMIDTGVIPTDLSVWIYYPTLSQIPIKVISFISYLVLSIKMLVAHKKRIKDIFAYEEKITLNWITYLLALFGFGLLQGVSILLFFQEFADQTQFMGYMGLFSAVAIFYLGTMGLLQPQVYLRTEQDYLAQAATSEQEKPNNSKPEKYQKSALTMEDMQRIANKLDKAMLEKRYYLDSDLTMPQLADYLSVSSNYLSQTVNSIHRVSFFEYINRLRVEYAKQQLVNPAKSQDSIVDIAADAAFNSRSAFYSAFKKHSGMTPAQYRNQQAA